MKKGIFFHGVLALLIVSGLLAACSKSYNNNYTVPMATNDTIHIKSTGFSPGTLQVSVGATVIWVNDDQGTHSVIADDGSFNSGDVMPGATFSYMFNPTGAVSYSYYHCGHHPAEKGTVIVSGR
jgi:plastocyanin